MSTPITVRVQSEDFDLGREIQNLTEHNHDLGAVASFVGLCRDENQTLEALELEHYPGMAETQIEKIALAATQRWPIDGLTVVHRVGKIPVGGQIVMVVVTSRQRDAAFDGARFIMDYLKTDAPFWKKEHRLDESAGGWVSARDEDETAKTKWDAVSQN